MYMFSREKERGVGMYLFFYVLNRTFELHAEVRVPYVWLQHSRLGNTAWFWASCKGHVYEPTPYVLDWSPGETKKPNLQKKQL